jgi:hypothetical protein
MNVVFLSVLDHLVPLQDFRLFLDELIPGDVWSAGVDLNHLNAIIDRTDGGAKRAADAVFFTNDRPESFSNFIGQFHIFQVDALVSSVVASDETQIALDAFVVIDASYGLEAQIEVAERADARQRLADEVRAVLEAALVHPIGHAVNQIFDNAESEVHNRGADLHAC